MFDMFSQAATLFVCCISYIFNFLIFVFCLAFRRGRRRYLDFFLILIFSFMFIYLCLAIRLGQRHKRFNVLVSKETYTSVKRDLH